MPFAVTGHRHEVDGVHLVAGRDQRAHEQTPVRLGRHHHLGRLIDVLGDEGLRAGPALHPFP
jgi:hypothetical protein